jgi:glycosyltransferase involved in cell wall biosynthesis
MLGTLLFQKLDNSLRRYRAARLRSVSHDLNSTLPLVSVIIPTHNRSRLLRLAVESVLAQTYPHVEVIVVDDGSTDDTAEVMAQYAGRVTHIRQANQGVAAARNRGIRAASGEYLTCLDDDDLLLPTKIERQVRVLVSQPEVSLVHCRFYFANGDGDNLYKAKLLPEGKILKELIGNNFIWSGAPLIRRHCFDQVGLFDEEISSVTADWDMWLRIARAGYRFACVQETLGVYRVHQHSMMSDVAKLEHGVFAVLERAFSNSNVPAEAVAEKGRIYGDFRAWISCRYYAASQWDDAQRNLSEALALHLQLRTDPTTLVELFASDALSPRVADPFGFIADVLDHLPPCADGLRQYRSQLLSRIYTELALRNYGAGQISRAQSQVAEAIALDPAGFERMEDFARLLSHCAVYLPIRAPTLYVDTVLQNLPPGAQRLQRVRARVLSEVNVKLARHAYLTDRWDRAVRRMLTALRYCPSLIKSRVVVSILLKSLIGIGKE